MNPPQSALYASTGVYITFICLNIPQVTPKWGSKLLAKNSQKWQFLSKSTFGPKIPP